MLNDALQIGQFTICVQNHQKRAPKFYTKQKLFVTIWHHWIHLEKRQFCIFNLEVSKNVLQKCYRKNKNTHSNSFV